MLLALSDVLDLPVVRRARPRVVVGADRLNTPVRWAHVAEVTDLAHLLRGGELVLTTGIALPDEEEALRRYVTDLAEAGVSGIAVELGRKYRRQLPDALVEAAREAGVPVICLERETRFVEITEAVHSRVLTGQLEELRASERMHTVFTELSLEGAPRDRVLQEAARLSGCPVVLENLAHQVLAYALNGEDPGVLLASWESRSRAVSSTRRTFHDPVTGWLVTTVGARGQDWGRLILICGASPTSSQTTLVERAATTLALGRLLERQQESLERQTHRTIIAGIIDRSYSDPQEALVRARAVGVPLAGRTLVAVVLRLRDAGTGLATQARLAEVAENVARVCRELRLPALVGSLDDLRVGVLLALPAPQKVERCLERLAPLIHEHAASRVVVAVGSPVDDIRRVRSSFLEARQVADIAVHQATDRPYHRLFDLRLRGLLHLMRDDERLQTYVERELGPLLAYDAQHGEDLTSILRHYLDAGRNKALAASRAHLSRPTFYGRLRRISRILGADLESVETCLSLHVALLALESVRDRISR